MNGYLPDLGFDNTDILTFDNNQTLWNKLADAISHNPWSKKGQDVIHKMTPWWELVSSETTDAAKLPSINNSFRDAFIWIHESSNRLDDLMKEINPHWAV